MHGRPGDHSGLVNAELLRQAEELEAIAARERVEYFADLLRLPEAASLLDVGCGNGEAVRSWRESGVRAFGVDSSLYRLGRWIAMGRRGAPLVVADAAAMPFAGGTFEDVISSGMIEHVGVRESPNPYLVSAAPDRDQRREGILAEMLRVTRPGGTTIVDCPNGIFPIDFWHGDTVGAFRIHRIPDVLLPTPGQFRSWGRHLGFHPRLRRLSGRLRFRQVGRHWWGRLLRPLMAIHLRVLDLLVGVGLGRLAAPAYPYLVVQLERDRQRPEA